MTAASFLTEFGVDAAAIHRLTRLATRDEITQGPRDRIIEHAYTNAGRLDYAAAQEDHGIIDLSVVGHWQELVDHDEEPPKLATLVTCRWCASIYVAAGVVVARRVAPRWWAPVARLLALSSVSTLIAGLEQ